MTAAYFETQRPSNWLGSITEGQSSFAQKIASTAKLAQEHFTHTTINQSHIDKILDDIIEILEECKTDGWDGYQAKAIAPATLNNVITFSDSLNIGLPQPEICPEADGEIALEWFGENNSTMSISIGSSNTINYSAIFPDGHCTHGTENLQKNNNSMLESYIQRVTKK
jgi:hypothetical protein